MITSTDPIADMLSRIRNAIAVRHHVVRMPHSKAKQAVAQLLKENGFLRDVSVEDAIVGKTLVVTISDESTNARISHVARISKPGRRHYSGASKIPTVKQGRGLVIVSTSRGLMTGTAAKQAGVGGEVICEVY